LAAEVPDLRDRRYLVASEGEASPKEVRLTFDELALIYKSLEAAKTLGALPPQDELLEDTIQIVDQSLNTFVH
jgi:hypothetical protein